MSANKILEIRDSIFTELESCIKEAKDFETKRNDGIRERVLKKILSKDIERRCIMYQFMLKEGVVDEDNKEKLINNLGSDKSGIIDYLFDNKDLSTKQAKFKRFALDITDYEARKKSKVIDSVDSYFTLGNLTAEIIGELSNITSKEATINTAKAFCHGFDSKLYLILDEIENMESSGYNGKWIKEDINVILDETFSAFAKFDIDLSTFLKENSDYEKRFGNYDEFRVSINENGKAKNTPSNKTVLSRWNKPILGREQINILFNVLKDCNIINKEVQRQTMDISISLLTGYSEKQIHKGTNTPANEITRDISKIDEIQEALRAVIDKLEQEKKTI